MWRKTLIISTVGLIGFLAGMMVGRFAPEAPFQLANKRLDGPVLPLDAHDAAIASSLRSDVSGPAQNIQSPVRGRQGAAEQTGTKAEEVSGKTATQALRPEASIALTPDQQRLYSDLYQRIETAPYGGFTMGELQSKMADMPREYQAKLLEQVVNLVNSGKLDPQRFVEGNR